MQNGNSSSECPPVIHHPEPEIGSARYVESSAAQIVGERHIFTTLLHPPANLPLQKTTGQTSPERHQYSPIGLRSIRLLKCVQRSELEPTYDFVTLPLQDAYDKFVAISYVWGTAQPDRVLPLKDGSHILITENVEKLLSYIFPVDEEYVWLDAICINQEDAKEKNSQVKLMKDVYSSARRVSIWLGFSQKEMDVYVTLLKYGIELGREGSRGRDVKAVIDGMGWFGGLMDLPWWYRVWVVQEVCYGRNVWFHYGRIMMPWAFIDSAFRLVEKANESLFNTESGTSRNGALLLRAFEQFKMIIRGDGVFDLEVVYETLYLSKSTDPRDRIFAILSLVTPSPGVSCIVPDYETSTREVFVHAMTSMLVSTPDFCILGRAGLATPRQIYDGRSIPSWVVDFANYFLGRCLTTTSRINNSLYDATPHKRPEVAVGVICDTGSGSKLYNSAPGTHSCVPHGSHCTSQGESARCPFPHTDILSLSGSHFDRIKGIGTRSPGLDPTVGALFQFLEEGLRIAITLVPYPTGELAKEVCWRTLITNCVGGAEDPRRADATFGTGFNVQYNALREAKKAGKRDEISWKYAWPKQRKMCSEPQRYCPQVWKRMFWTENGFFGLAHNDIQVGDSLWLIYGARVPFIVRPSRNVGNIKLHQLVCEAYVHGAMNGEAMKMNAVENATLHLE
ncbi:HET-domain-containing protein [Hyaloscypha variabilis F]|uniref:HET-domain-containing protein n=1 Tax=Hyaloscypha variabilis (strain UAMH 11265 / GT02V1 / F) TaxID=1149755 RepID=A0A2J6RCR8_HYAVF|nr:HET-domain-containing protein [Hyaloscypha variabilis F]